ncbi:MAG: ABC transporter permease subunit [Actinophytocola sp.]|nr:ABC transporter permease subunit [Actinophytocola sp.]
MAPQHATATRAPREKPSARRSSRRSRRLERYAPYLFITPLLVIFVGFYLYPALVTVLSSFFRWGLLRPWSPAEPERWNFVGLDNYGQTLTDASFWNATLNTAIWLVVFPLLVAGLSLLVSILIWYLARGGAVFRTMFILPMTISLAATGVIWSLIYNPDPQVGLLNAVLDKLGILGADWNVGPLEVHTGAWLSDPGVLHLGFADLRLTNLALVIPAFWAFTGFGVITLTAGLTSVSYELVEAAKVDGANTWQVARYVLIPALRAPLVVVGVVSVIFALRTFDIVFVMTGGGPAEDTMVLALLLWQQAFAFLDTPQAGLATAIAVLLSVVMIVAAYRYLRQLLTEKPG